MHATTLFTNALIERKGARTGLITTAGFRDTLEIGRERKYELYDLNIVKPEPLVPRHLRLEVRRAHGAPTARVRRRSTSARRRGAGPPAGARPASTSLAIVFLHAYANPRHERRPRGSSRARHPDARA